jgi:hypothetical protein
MLKAPGKFLEPNTACQCSAKGGEYSFKGHLKSNVWVKSGFSGTSSHIGQEPRNCIQMNRCGTVDFILLV